MQFSKNNKIVQVITPTAGAAATTDINGTTIDTQGFQNVTFIVTFGAITAGAVTSIKAQQSTASDMTGAADLEGTSQTIADSDDGKVFYVDIRKPSERYVRLVVDRATQDAVVASAIAVLSDASEVPVTHGTNVSGEAHVSPAEGTA